MTSKLIPSEQLVYCTTRIECDCKDGSVSVGTGFFFAFLYDGNVQFPALVTNKHVVEDSINGRFQLHAANEGGDPLPGENFEIGMGGFEQRWVSHPDPDVDLCVLPVGALINAAADKGRRIFWRSFDHSFIPGREALDDFAALENILMIGYPTGIWDSVNNFPLMRRGITATQVAVDYEGKEEFLIDAACFPGSSGSPVLIFDPGGHPLKGGGFMIGERTWLMGILYAGPQFTAKGKIEVVNVPTKQVALAKSKIPMNLGVCIKAHRLLEFEPILQKLAK